MFEAVAKDWREQALRVSYESLARFDVDAQTLAVIGFAGQQLPADPRVIQSGFRPLAASAHFQSAGDLIEVWRAAGPVTIGSQGALRFAHDGGYLFGVLEIDERAAGSIALAAKQAYAEIVQFTRSQRFGKVLRYWNYFSHINEGQADQERYRQFCTGRAQGLGVVDVGKLPAATAIGRQDDSPLLQVYWLASHDAGLNIENPRQVSAYRYPRRYGPTSPSFSRAHLLPASQLLISGTASVVGHESHHVDDLRAQLNETLRNLQTVITCARQHQAELPAHLNGNSLLKVYLRDPDLLRSVQDTLASLPDTPWIIVAGDICRADLLIEIDGVHRV